MRVSIPPTGRFLNMFGSFDRAGRTIAQVAGLLLVLLLSTVGCSGGLHPVSPSDSGGMTVTNGVQNDSRALLGYYLMTVNADRTAINIEPVRGVAWHMNALGLIQAYDPTAISLGAMYGWDDGSVTVTINLHHPLANTPSTPR